MATMKERQEEARRIGTEAREAVKRRSRIASMIVLVALIVFIALVNLMGKT